MPVPSMTDYVKTYFTLYEHLEQEQKESVHRGHPFDYETRVLILFFIMMIIRRITTFKAQHRWLKKHPGEAEQLGFGQIPVRTTLSRRYKGGATLKIMGHTAKGKSENLRKGSDRAK